MHDSVMRFVQKRVTENRLGRLSVLDVGSLSVNGSVREMFTEGKYIGIDMRPGKNVDRVMNAHDLVDHFGEGVFDVVVSCEMLEHDDAFWLSLDQMGRVLKPGGHLIVTTRSPGFPKHDHPTDFWRFMYESIPVLARIAGVKVAHMVADDQADGIFFHGVKP